MHIEIKNRYRILLCILLGWSLAAFSEYMLLTPELRDLSRAEGAAAMSPLRFGIVMTAGVLICFILSGSFLNTRHLRYMLAGILFVSAVAALISAFSYGMLAASTMIIAALIMWEPPGHFQKPSSERLWKRGHDNALFCGAAAFFVFISLWGIFRYLTFSCPTYDMGLFSQMFYNMKETGLPLTTLERDALLSHFKVHLSPIYYLMLPFYCIFPHPLTLQVLQAAVMASAVIPLRLLCKKRGFSGMEGLLICIIFLLQPVFSGGASFDIHENCFLTPLLLWLFLAAEKEKPWPLIVSCLLIFAVKEDASVYTGIFGLYMMLTPGKGRGRKYGAAMLAASVIMFCADTYYLTEYGTGVMNYRYENFCPEGKTGLIHIIATAVMEPMKVLYECTEAEKLGYMFLTLFPLAGIPFLCRRPERLVLLMPYLLFNLMSDYTYQHSIFYQYGFGSFAFLIYLFILNLEELRNKAFRRKLLLASMAVSAAAFAAVIVPEAARFPARYAEDREYFESVSGLLDKIPEDASVAASTLFTAALSQRENICDIYYASLETVLDSDYVVLMDFDMETVKYGGIEKFLELLEENGFLCTANVNDKAFIMKNSGKSP